MITVTVPIPPTVLSPNARAHWAVKARAVKKARGEARLLALAALGRNHPPRWKAAQAVVTWYAATRRRQDRDNLSARLKATYDGIADAGIVEDDSGLLPLPPVLAHDPKNPRVVIVLSEVIHTPHNDRPELAGL